MAAENEITVAARSFRAVAGREDYFTVQATGGGDFAVALAAVEEAYREAVRAAGLGPESAVFRRVLVSDIANQGALVRAGALAGDGESGPVALSVVQQPPLPPGRLALLACHLHGGVSKRRLSPRLLEVVKSGRRHLWSTGITGGATVPPVDAGAQTETVFAALTGDLAAEGATLARDCHRTWLYVKGVDVFYQDLVERRNVLFGELGLGRETHSIASTGIEGACGGRYEVVGLDAYSVPGLEPAQVSYLDAPERIGATYDYGVAFERCTRLAYADRAHFLLSGTASIDPAGNVVHPGDVDRQLERALANVDALLSAGGAGLADLMHLTAYVRDAADAERVRDALAALLPGLPCLLVLAPVCRPEWLVEVEGVAIARRDDPALPAF